MRNCILHVIQFTLGLQRTSTRIAHRRNLSEDRQSIADLVLGLDDDFDDPADDSDEDPSFILDETQDSTVRRLQSQLRQLQIPELNDTVDEQTEQSDDSEDENHDVQNEDDDPEVDTTFQWTTNSFTPPQSTTCMLNDLKPDEKIVHHPLVYFQRYFTPELMQLIVEKTNQRSTEKYGKSIETNFKEIHQLFGMHIVMGNLGFPRVRLYWEKQYRIAIIADTMRSRRFFQLRYCLSAADPADIDVNNPDNLHLIRPVIDAVKARCAQLTEGEHSAVDEQMVPYKGRMKRGIKQVVKNKPTPEEAKIFVRASSDTGLMYEFEVYQGANTGFDPAHRSLGLGGAVVLRLTSNIPRNLNYKVFFDNYFSSVPLLLTLKNRGILAVGVAKGGSVNKESTMSN